MVRQAGGLLQDDGGRGQPDGKRRRERKQTKRGSKGRTYRGIDARCKRTASGSGCDCLSRLGGAGGSGGAGDAVVRARVVRCSATKEGRWSAGVEVWGCFVAQIWQGSADGRGSRALLSRLERDQLALDVDAQQEQAVQQSSRSSEQASRRAVEDARRGNDDTGHAGGCRGG